jgi:predicted PurR-regulated permease PerM
VLSLGGRWRAPQGLAVVTVYLGMIGAIIVGLDLLLPLLSDQIETLLANTPIYAKQLDEYGRWLSSLPTRYRLPLAWRQSTTDGINVIIGGGLGWLKSVTLGLVGLTLYLPWLILIPVCGFFFLKDARTLYGRLLSNFTEEDQRSRVAHFLRDVSAALAAYIRAQITACLLIGLVVGGGLGLLGAPYSLVFGVMAGLLEFIPIVGPAIVALLAALVASFVSWRLVAIVLAFLGLLRLVHDYIIYPRLISHSIELHPIVIILAVLCGAELGGVIGVFLSVPAVALLIVSWRHWQMLRADQQSITPATVVPAKLEPESQNADLSD